MLLDKRDTFPFSILQMPDKDSSIPQNIFILYEMENSQELLAQRMTL